MTRLQPELLASSPGKHVQASHDTTDSVIIKRLTYDWLRKWGGSFN